MREGLLLGLGRRAVAFSGEQILIKNTGKRYICVYIYIFPQKFGHEGKKKMQCGLPHAVCESMCSRSCADPHTRLVLS